MLLNPININEWLCRCSGLGKILTEPQKKSPAQAYADAVALAAEKKEAYELIEESKRENKTNQAKLETIKKLNAEILRLEPLKDQPYISATAESFVTQSVRGMRWERWESFGSKHTIKGGVQEDESLTLWSKLHPEVVLPTRNVERFNNAFLSGMPDIKDIDDVIQQYDLKSSWDWTTFPYPGKELDSIYKWQNIGYCCLFEREYWITSYNLVNTPPRLIEMEIERKWRDMGCPNRADDQFLLAAIEIEKNSIYDRFRFEKDCHETGYPYQYQVQSDDWDYDVPESERTIEMRTDWSQALQDEAYERVALVRRYILKTYPSYFFMPKSA